MNNNPACATITGALCAGLLGLAGALLPASAAADPFQYGWQEIAPGVHVGIRAQSARTPVMGTTTFVVSDKGVVVFDGGGVPLMSERSIEKIRSVTDRPVTHVVVSHWHQDHNWGIKAFADAYPGVAIIAHPYTRDALMSRNPEAEVQAATAIERQIPALLARLESEQMVAGERARLQTLVDDAPVIGREYQRLASAYPDVTFEDRLVIHSGDRTIELLHLGRGNTAGDIVMWLPQERIVAAGDLVVHPTPFGFGSYPGDWAATLRKLNALDFKILVPGHGDIQHDSAYVELLIETFELVATQIAPLVAQGLDEDAAVARLDWSSVETRFTGGDEFLAGRFLAWFKRPIGRAAYKVASGESPEVD